ncbi:MAG: hypothetical protein WD749_08350 [Phycisphaerales bacterium]
MRAAPTIPALPAVAAAVLLSAAAGAQPPAADDGPVIVGEPRMSFRPFTLERFDAGLEFFAQRRLDRLRRRGQPTLVNREDLLRESLDLSLQGAVGHKNLLDFTGTARLGLEDRWFRSDTDSARGHDTDLAALYDLSGLILQTGPVPTTVYTRREEALLDREFAPSVRNTTTESGVIARITSADVPTTLQYFHREQEQSDRPGVTNFTTIQDTFGINSDLRLAERQNLTLDYTFDRVEESQTFGFDDRFDRHDGTLSHLVEFGGRHRSDLRSTLRFYDQSGRFDQQILRLDERLVLRHTDRFETRYDATLERQERAGAEQRLARGAASLRHRLFESLVSTAGVGAQRFESEGGFTSDTLFVTGALQYTKRAPRGRLDAAVGATYDTQRSSERGEPVSILGETHIFSDPLPITLSRRNVVPGSVVVRPPSGFPVFVEGIDYELRVFPDRVEIRPIPGGAITSGTAVVVDYDIGPEPANTVDTLGTSISARYTLTEGPLRGLAAFVDYRQLDHELSTEGPATLIVDDVRDLTVGAEFLRGPVTLRAERQHRDSTVNPFDATRLEGRYNQRLGRDSALSLEAIHEIIDYRDSGERIEFDRLSARWAHRVNPELHCSLRLLYRDERTRLSGDTRGLEQALEVNWRRRQTDVYASVRNAILDVEGGETLSQTFQFGLRRRF